MRVLSACLHVRHWCPRLVISTRRLVNGHAVKSGHRVIRRAKDSLQSCPEFERQGAVLFSLFPRVQHLIHDIDRWQSNPWPSARMSDHCIFEVFSGYNERQDNWRRGEGAVRQLM
jgi:hypothetical protein